MHRRMGGVRNNVWCEVYSEIEIDDDLCVGFGMSVIVPVPVILVVASVMMGVDDPGSGLFVSPAYVEMVCWRSRRVCKEKAVESFAWIAQQRHEHGISNPALRRRWHIPSSLR